jgi:hypothetical protein
VQREGGRPIVKNEWVIGIKDSAAKHLIVKKYWKTGLLEGQFQCRTGHLSLGLYQHLSCSSFTDQRNY